MDGNVTLAESTSILRYVGQLPGGEAWYGARSLQVIKISPRRVISYVVRSFDSYKERAKIDELLDHWQSTIHPNVIRLTQNKLFYKVRKG